MFAANDWVRVQTFVVLDGRSPLLIADVDLRARDVVQIAAAADDLARREAQ